jgi:Protein phosphatase 2C
MIWKVIGQSVIGSSHIQSDKTCEDAVHYEIVNLIEDEALICFVSDGAGSAKYAARASETAVTQGVTILRELISNGVEIDEQHLLALAENIYDKLKEFADELQEPVNEFSCTLLGFVILPEKACFLQIGDGAIVRSDGNGYFTHIWWPHNGEYQNTTAFLVDDPNFPNLKIKIVEESIEEVAVFTDGLQMLALNNESEQVHQPFFNDLFKWLRKASDVEHVNILNNKLNEYLAGDIINNRTDDDKTLLLATKVKYDAQGI